jgi:hypothetical protein
MMMLKSEIEDIATMIHQTHAPAMLRPVIQEEIADTGDNGDDDFAKFMLQQQQQQNGGPPPQEAAAAASNEAVEDEHMTKEEFVEPKDNGVENGVENVVENK